MKKNITLTMKEEEEEEEEEIFNLTREERENINREKESERKKQIEQVIKYAKEEKQQKQKLKNQIFSQLNKYSLLFKDNKYPQCFWNESELSNKSDISIYYLEEFLSEINEIIDNNPSLEFHAVLKNIIYYADHKVIKEHFPTLWKIYNSSIEEIIKMPYDEIAYYNKQFNRQLDLEEELDQYQTAMSDEDYQICLLELSSEQHWNDPNHEYKINTIIAKIDRLKSNILDKAANYPSILPNTNKNSLNNMSITDLEIIEMNYDEQISRTNDIKNDILNQVANYPTIFPYKTKHSFDNKSIEELEAINNQYDLKIKNYRTKIITIESIENSLKAQNERTQFYKWLLNPWYDQQKENNALISQQNNFNKSFMKTFTPDGQEQAKLAYRKIKNDEEWQALQSAALRGTIAVVTTGAVIGTAYYLSKKNNP